MMKKKIYKLSIYCALIGSSLHAGFADKAMHILRKQGPEKFIKLITQRFKFDQATGINYTDLSIHKSKPAHISDLQTARTDIADILENILTERDMPDSLKKMLACRIGLGVAALGTTAYISPLIDPKLDTPFCFTTAGALVGSSFLISAAQGYSEEVIARREAFITMRRIENRFDSGLKKYLKGCKYNPGVAIKLTQRIVR